MDPFRILRDVE